jgi:hypothetical protein
MKTTRTPSSLLLLLPFALAGALSACSGSSEGQQASVGASPSGSQASTYAAPPGCAHTLCDLIASYCVEPPDPCEQCWNTCSTLDPSVAAECASTCTDICRQGNTAPPVCKTALDSCRHTPKNAVCADHLSEPAPTGQPCNEDLNTASCACGYDGACSDALDKVNPKCVACDDTWAQTCLDAVCNQQRTTAEACLSQHGCKSTVDCSACETEAKAWDACLNAAFADPSDVGSCYSGSHKCWANPICPATN